MSLLYAACAIAYALVAAFSVSRRMSNRVTWSLTGGCLLTAFWAFALATGFRVGIWDVTLPLELLVSLAWSNFLLQLYQRAGLRARQVGRILFGVALLAALFVALSLWQGGNAGDALSLGSAAVSAPLCLALVNMLVIENLYRNTADDWRWHINLACIAIGGFYAFTVILYADAVLFRRLSPPLLETRAVVALMVTPLLAIASVRQRRWRGGTIALSRSAVFHSATLIAGGIFLVGLALTGEVFRRYGADWGVLAEASLISGGVVAIAVVASSGSARSRLVALVVDHFFTHRYDYRREWLRCIATLSDGNTRTPLQTRVVRAVADTVDSPAGVLLLREDAGAALCWAGEWNLPLSMTPLAIDHPLIAAMGGGGWIVEFDRSPSLADGLTPDGQPGFWLAVPLSHGGALLGCILLTRSRAGFALDREVFDLLRILGREVAAFLAEQRATQQLLQTRALHDYGQRFAFVAHDIKNLSSQLALLLNNAEIHIANPEFQRDMLGTIRASVQKIASMLARLQAPAEAPATRPPAPPGVVPEERLPALIAAIGRGRDVAIGLDGDSRTDRVPAQVSMAAAAFDDVITHLLTNAVEASPPGAAVRLVLRQEGDALMIDIVDQGAGMSAAFIRDVLFRPLATSKRHGSGIGAFQARALLREAGGDLLVLSTPGLGTTMRLRLPLRGVPAGRAATEIVAG
jgi:putative PEP-CTERM system histidine kinase